MSIKVILADDHNLVREGLRLVIERKASDIEVVGEASNGHDVLAVSLNNPADVYVLDVAMPGLNGLEAACQLIKKYPGSKIIMLSMYEDAALVERAFKYGVKGYLLKDNPSDDIIAAIRQVHEGKYFIATQVSKFIVDGFVDKKNGTTDSAKNNRRKITDKEKEVLQLIVDGNSTKEIARHLGISFNTAVTHRKNIMRKLSMKRQTALIRFALKQGLSSL